MSIFGMWNKTSMARFGGHVIIRILDLLILLLLLFASLIVQKVALMKVLGAGSEWENIFAI